MPALRCSMCSVNWPPTSEFETCPECENKTDRLGNADPIEIKEALSRKSHKDFDRYYEARENQRLADELAEVTTSSGGEQ